MPTRELLREFCGRLGCEMFSSSGVLWALAALLTCHTFA